MRLLVPLLASAMTLVCVRAKATPRPLPFTYQHEQLDAGEAEIEQYADFTPVRARDSQSGDNVYYGLTQFQTEFEYGITPRLELGLYFTFVPTTTNGFAELPRATEGNGLKQRLRWQLAPTGEWPIDEGERLHLDAVARDADGRMAVREGDDSGFHGADFPCPL